MSAGRRALVAFSGRAALWWLRLLKPGFRHCLVAIQDPAGWIVIDPLSHRTEVDLLPLPPDFDLAAWYREAGLIVVDTVTRQPPRRPAPWRPYSCVESVKRVLGIQDGRILTPWQLYNFFRREGKKALTPGGD